MTHPLKFSVKTEITSLLLIILSFILGFYFYQNFPDLVPTHWNIHNQVDGWSSRGFAAFFVPFLLLGMYLLFILIPYLDPKKDRYKEFSDTYHVFKNALIIIMYIIYLMTGLSGLGYSIDIGLTVSITIGLFFILIGTQMKHIKPNWFMGIRTPWTLSNEIVWKKTHELGGITFSIAGVILMLAGYFKSELSFIILLVAIGIAGIVPVVYSYLLYRKFNNK